MPEISIIIPVRRGGNPYVTLKALAAASVNTIPSFEVIVAHDSAGNGANWARNAGAKLARAPFLLFSDDDIEWMPTGLADLFTTLQRTPEASYAYGSYVMAGRFQCNLPFVAERLRRSNFISTMSMIRAEHFPGFDETIPRLQDWDLWLTMLEAGHVGVSCGSLIFQTREKDGITKNGPVSWQDARDLVARKHNL